MSCKNKKTDSPKNTIQKLASDPTFTGLLQGQTPCEWLRINLDQIQGVPTELDVLVLFGLSCVVAERFVFNDDRFGNRNVPSKPAA